MGYFVQTFLQGTVPGLPVTKHGMGSVTVQLTMENFPLQGRRMKLVTS